MDKLFMIKLLIQLQERVINVRNQRYCFLYPFSFWFQISNAIFMKRKKILSHEQKQNTVPLQVSYLLWLPLSDFET